MRRIEHLAMIAHDMGIIFEFLGVVTLVPFIVLILYQEWSMALPMASAPLTFLLLGYLVSRIPRSHSATRLSVAMVAVALTWLVISFVGALPFILGMHMTFTDSVFEAMSGWTGTGFTVIATLDTAPRTILFWRSFMQWIGGIGVISFGIAMLSRSGLTQYQLYRSEGRSEALMPSIVSTGRRIWGIYLALTIIFTAVIGIFVQLPLWDSLNLVMTTLSTGGFSVHEAGVSYYNSALLEALLIPIMLAGAIPFKVYFFLYRGRFNRFFRDSTVRLILALSVIVSLVVSLNLYIFNSYPLSLAVRQGFFCTISGFTCCGLQNSTLQWLALPLILVMLLMMIGGAAGSTAGGIKVNRVILSYEGLVWWFKRFFVRGNVIVPFKHEGKNIPGNISELELSKNLLIVVLYVLLIFVATILLLHPGTTLFAPYQVIFEIVSAASNVGLGVGYLTPFSPWTVKWVFILVMWIGRLEIIPVLILVMGALRGFEAATRG
jgi:trk system potassium uptake protein TrkH